jgi:hypothetical protein
VPRCHELRMPPGSHGNGQYKSTNITEIPPETWSAARRRAGAYTPGASATRNRGRCPCTTRKAPIRAVQSAHGRTGTRRTQSPVAVAGTTGTAWHPS